MKKISDNHNYKQKQLKPLKKKIHIYAMYFFGLNTKKKFSLNLLKNK